MAVLGGGDRDSFTKLHKGEVGSLPKRDLTLFSTIFGKKNYIFLHLKPFKTLFFGK